MASRSWNHIELMGNLTRDPELRFIPSGTPVCTFGMATNRSYVTPEGERREDVDFHRLVAWGKLAELCNQLLKKGSKVFISGRLQYREWEGQDGQKHRDAEIVIEDMILVTPKIGGTSNEETVAPTSQNTPVSDDNQTSPAPQASVPSEDSHDDSKKTESPKEDVAAEDLPF